MDERFSVVNLSMFIKESRIKISDDCNFVKDTFDADNFFVQQKSCICCFPCNKKLEAKYNIRNTLVIRFLLICCRSHYFY